MCEYMLFQARNDYNGIPRDIEGQAVFWTTYYRTTGNVTYFIEASNELEQGCFKSLGVDMVFVLDESGSIRSDNFEKIRNFTRDVINGFDIGHVSVLNFDDD